MEVQLPTERGEELCSPITYGDKMTLQAMAGSISQIQMLYVYEGTGMYPAAG